jgi:hypothetical protein
VPLLNAPESPVAVCDVESLLVHVTVVPALTVSGFGLYAVVVSTCAPDTIVTGVPLLLPVLPFDGDVSVVLPLPPQEVAIASVAAMSGKRNVRVMADSRATALPATICDFRPKFRRSVSQFLRNLRPISVYVNGAAVDAIVEFYSGGRDYEGRTLDAILGWDDDRLEMIHDYIQWVFPLRQPSAVNPFAPLVTDETVRAFDRDPALRERLERAYERMLRFYGLLVREGRVEIDERTFPSRSQVWLTPGNHNHLRLTRIMQCLSALGLRANARALQRCLIDEICTGPGRGRISARTIEFWRRAISA